MPSPFPGMNPYLERAGVWPMFHSQFISVCQQSLAKQLRPKYVVRMETRVYIHEPSAAERFAGEPDLGIARAPRFEHAGAGVAVATPAPAYGTIPAWVELEKSRYLEIRDRESDRLVTLIELLSPANKYSGPDRDQYIAKRSQLLLSQAHLIEIDLLRGGPRMPVDAYPPGTQYVAVVSRVSERPKVGIWSWTLRDSLPDLPVPVADGDPDARLELRRTLDAVYDAGAYSDFIYTGPPEPRLGPDDAAWLEQFLV